MNKIFGIIFGSLAVILGISFFIAWWEEIIILFKATFPLILIMGGILAVIAGVSETIDTFKARKNK